MTHCDRFTESEPEPLPVDRARTGSALLELAGAAGGGEEPSDGLHDGGGVGPEIAAAGTVVQNDRMGGVGGPARDLRQERGRGMRLTAAVSCSGSAPPRAAVR
ncbi:hypothetical protein GCM10010260_29920 [Streptomyces filipinensis]|uniref:Uncharacterized protein n=1 Tax=Streptomyces filipinensis TaxID=66887 RepID=A0A918MBJ9_9ACTN|nr:hypothetical protein GCM10010260_29920 [Streptomyces filipinensis]